MQGSDIHSRRLGAILIMAGAILATASVGTAFAAADHMAAASLCGPVAGHCILCVAAAASLLASSGVIASGALLRWSSRFPRFRVSRA